MARTISVDDRTYKELILMTAQLMQKAEEQVSVSDIARLSVYLFKGCLTNYPRLEQSILDQISFEEKPTAPKYFFSKDLTPEWFDKDFLEWIFGIEDLLAQCNSISQESNEQPNEKDAQG